jgi:DNA-binding MurR/RpiR family transcriptional regulator
MSGVTDLLEQRMREAWRSPSDATLRIIRFIEANPGLAVTLSAADLAKRVGVSDASIVRTAQALGLGGMAGLRQAIAEALEAGSPAARMARTLVDAGPDTDRVIDLALEAHAEALTVLRDPATRQRLRDTITLLGNASRVVVYGIGPTAMLAGYTAMLLTRAGRQARSLEKTGTELADELLDLRMGDATLVLAYGRPYREVTATIAAARRVSAPIAMITDSATSELAAMADIVVPIPRGQAERVALHGATLVALEALVLGLAATDQPRALAALERLNALRRDVSGQRRSDADDPSP